MIGFLPVDKPDGCTSHDVVARIRRVLGGLRVGHAGTLDPMATGLLVCGIGQATRLLQYVQAHHKTYEGTMRLGVVTDTQDITGAILDKTDGVAIRPGVIALAARGFVGLIAQVPPAYSAIKVGGIPLHRRIRRGMEYTPPPARQVEISRIEILEVAGPDVRFRVTCGSGTYIRALCHDWGAALEVGGCLAALRRTRSGPFDVADAPPLAELTTPEAIADNLHTVDDVFADWPRRVCTATEVETVRHGQLLGDTPWDAGTHGCLVTPSGHMFALATARAGQDGVALRATPVLTSVLDAEAPATS